MKPGDIFWKKKPRWRQVFCAFMKLKLELSGLTVSSSTMKWFFSINRRLFDADVWKRRHYWVGATLPWQKWLIYNVGKLVVWNVGVIIQRQGLIAKLCSKTNNRMVCEVRSLVWKKAGRSCRELKTVWEVSFQLCELDRNVRLTSKSEVNLLVDNILQLDPKE